MITLRRKPIEVQAVLWDGTSDSTMEIFNFVGDAEHFDYDPAKGNAEVYDYLHDTWIHVHIGDYIIRGTRGEHYPVSAKTLGDLYDVID